MQVVDEDQEDPAGGVVGRPRRRQDDAFLRRRRRRLRDVVDAPAVRQRERHELLLHAVFEDLELVLLQVRDELSAAVADDHVGGDQLDARADHLFGLPSVARCLRLGGRDSGRGPLRPSTSAIASAQGHISRGRVFTCMLRLYRELASGLARRSNRRRRRLGRSRPVLGASRHRSASAPSRLDARGPPDCPPGSAGRGRLPRRRRRRFWPTTSRSDANTDSYCSSPWTTSSSVTHASGLRRSASSFSSSRRAGSAARSEIRAEDLGVARAQALDALGSRASRAPASAISSRPEPPRTAARLARRRGAERPVRARQRRLASRRLGSPPASALTRRPSGSRRRRSVATAGAGGCPAAAAGPRPAAATRSAAPPAP